GVDVLGRQRGGDVEVVPAADRGQLLLLEDVVPDLQVAFLVDVRTAGRAEVRSAVVEHLRVRAAGAGDAHVPVVLAEVAAVDPLVRQTDGAPDLAGLDVTVRVGRVEAGAQHRHR